MIWKNIQQASIKQRVLIVTLLPLLLITLMLGGYFINIQLQDAEDALIERGKTMSMLMSSAAEFGLLTRNPEMLTSLIRGPSKEFDISDIVFIGREFDVLLRLNQYGSPILRDQAYPYSTDREIFFLQSVVTTGIDVQDSPEFPDEISEPEIIGWVAISLSRVPTVKRQQEIILKGVSIAFIGFLLTLLVAVRFGRRITNPILDLTQVVQQLEKGDLDVRSTIHATGELHTLSRGINRLTQKVQESNQTLESRVDLATERLNGTLVHLELQNEALTDARKKADAANRAKDDFLARMSHELRTPLTSVLGFSKLLDQTTLNTEQKEYTRIINLTSSLLLSIIDDILDFSKLQSSAIKLEKLNLNIESLVYDIVEMQSPSAHTKGLELIPIISPNIPTQMIGDPMRIRQILTNLVSNAIKFTERGHVIINISAEAIAENKASLSILVEDTGIGISKSRIRTLFQAFAQADNSITRKFGGSGLGLVIAKLLSELMGGSISLDSIENKGTSLRVNFPLTIPLRQESAVLPPKKQGAILIFDEHPIIRRSLAQQLCNCTLQLDIADSLEDLLARLLDKNPETLIWGLEPGATKQAAFINQVHSVCSNFSGRVILLVCEQPEIALPRNIDILRKPARTVTLISALLQQHIAPPLEEKSTHTPKTPIRILVAEDNDFNRLLINRILEHSAVEIVETTNGEEAIQQALNEPFDLILMDVHMPKIDGIEATTTIRAHNPNVPIVALTANVIASEHQKLRTAGANKVLFKPINDQQLKSTIAALTQGETSAHSYMENDSNTLSLEDYKISKETLHNELKKQLGGLTEGFKKKNMKVMHHHSHQLLGLAGLYELPELEVAGVELSHSIKKERIKDIWVALWRLQRMVENCQY